MITIPLSHPTLIIGANRYKLSNFFNRISGASPFNAFSFGQNIVSIHRSSVFCLLCTPASGVSHRSLTFFHCPSESSTAAGDHVLTASPYFGNIGSWPWTDTLCDMASTALNFGIWSCDSVGFGAVISMPMSSGIATPSPLRRAGTLLPLYWGSWARLSARGRYKRKH